MVAELVNKLSFLYELILYVLYVLKNPLLLCILTPTDPVQILLSVFCKLRLFRSVYVIKNASVFPLKDHS
jgi:hypothetical protein